MIIDSDKIAITETKAFTLYRLENKVLFFDYKNDIDIDLDDVKEAFNLYTRHSENHTNKVLLTFGQYTSIDLDARKYSENKTMPTPAQAIVIRNLAQRILVRFYRILRKDSHPLKFFANTEDALSWLHTI